MGARGGRAGESGSKLQTTNETLVEYFAVHSFVLSLLSLSHFQNGFHVLCVQRTFQEDEVYTAI